MAKKILFLQLSPEFGSTKFGPFQGAEVRLGADPGRNDIVLPENLGVSAEHAKLVKQQDDAFIVAPVDRTSQVFVHRKDGRPPKQITAPQALTEGDGFSIGGADGPKFIIVLEFPKSAKAAPDGPKGGLGKAAQRLSGKSLMAEIKRLGFAKALTSKTGAALAKAYTFIKTGAFLQPRYIILGLFLLTGYIFAGTMSCGLAGLAFDNSAKADKIQDLENQCGIDSDDGEALNIGKQVKKMGGPAGADYKNIIDRDADLAALMYKKMHQIKQNSVAYEWAGEKKSNVETFRKSLEKATSYYDEPLVRVLTYLAAMRGDPASFGEFRIEQDGEGKETCYRGPLALSWRQGKRFELESLYLEAAVETTVADQGDRAVVEPLLEGEAKKMNETVDLADGDTIAFDNVTQLEKFRCAYQEGEDTRKDLEKLPVALKDVLGKKAKDTPNTPGANYVLNRLYRYYAADWYRGYKDAKFSEPKLGLASQLENAGSATKGDLEKTKDRVATTLAAAAVLPCLLITGNAEAPEYLVKDALAEKSKVDCAILLYFVDEKAATAK